MIRAKAPDWTGKGKGSPHLQLGRSPDGGKTWQFSEGVVAWSETNFSEVASLRLKNGRLLAALRRQIPGTKSEGFQTTVLTESSDDGKHGQSLGRWSIRPRSMCTLPSSPRPDSGYLLQLSFALGRLAIVSTDGSKTWTSTTRLSWPSRAESAWLACDLATGGSQFAHLLQ